MYQSGNKLFVYARQRDDTHLRAVFASQTEDPYFPVPFNTVKADAAFRELVEGARFSIGNTRVSCTRLNHPWIAMAYRLDCDGSSVVYCTDTAPFTDILLENEFIAQAPRPGDPLPAEHADKLRSMRDQLIGLCMNADLLIYDTQFTPAEYRAKPHWGHSTPHDAIEIAHAAKVKQLALFHHDPTRSDDAQDVIVEETRQLVAGSGIHVFGAQEQQEVLLGE
jgi:ribonuclease BN (tRNA processing enzyme)